MALQECLSVFLAAEDHMSTQFTWKEEFNIGVDNIDKEHQQLFEGINSLFLLTQKKSGWIGGKNSRKACRKGIQLFKQHALKHFADEELYMASIDYGGLEQHSRIHKGFREKTLLALERELEQADYSPEAIDHFLGVCAGWLIGHTTMEDQAITGRQSSMWVDLLEEGELNSVKRAITQVMYQIFLVKPKMISDAYNGEKFGTGIYYRLVYETVENGKTQEMLLAFEEKLLLRTIGEVMGNKSGKLSTALLHNARYTMQRFAGRVIKVFLKGDNPTLKEENLLSYDQFQKVFEECKRVASLLFDTGEGYFACCILTPDQISESPGIPISQENALDEVAHYLKERQELEAQPPKKKVLVVDDSATMRQGLKNLLGWDYEVSTVDNGLAAIRTVTLNRPDLILLDYDMPICNGKHTLELLRSETHSEDIPVIFLTARDDADSVKGVLSLKPSGYLLKTLGHAEIKARVDGFFEKNP